MKITDKFIAATELILTAVGDPDRYPTIMNSSTKTSTCATTTARTGIAMSKTPKPAAIVWTRIGGRWWRVDAGTREAMQASAAARRAYNPRRSFVVTAAGEDPQAVWEARQTRRF